MKTFTAIDFETAQGYRWSICQVGLVRVVDGEIRKKIDLLVQPPQNYYWKKFIAIHGISREMTSDAPTFDKVWPLLEPYIRNQTVVAHNSVFDFACIRQTLAWYGLDVPEYEGHCTYRLYSESLNDLCRRYHIRLNHHNALSDAMACARLFLRYWNQQLKDQSDCDTFCRRSDLALLINR